MRLEGAHRYSRTVKVEDNGEIHGGGAGGDTLDLRLADGTPEEAFERLARAVDERRVTIHQAREVADILDRRLRIIEAGRYLRRLESVEALALEAVRRNALLVPASKAVVDASPGEL